jgi:kinetochore protein Spc25, fungi type
MTSINDQFKAPPIPTFEFKFDEILTRMGDYQSQFDSYISQSRKLLIEKKQQFQRAYRENEQQIELLKVEIESYNNLALQNAENKAIALDELEESKNAIINYTAKRDQMTESFNSLQAEIGHIRQEVQKKHDQLAKEKQGIESQIATDQPEVQMWESTLGLRIEGVNRDDFIKFVFSLIDPSDEAREYSIVLDLRDYLYRIAECIPPLPQAEADRALQQLNDTRELKLFLKTIRNSFKNI